jgi:hypothetical protein
MLQSNPRIGLLIRVQFLPQQGMSRIEQWQTESASELDSKVRQTQAVQVDDIAVRRPKRKPMAVQAMKMYAIPNAVGQGRPLRKYVNLVP